MAANWVCVSEAEAESRNTMTERENLAVVFGLRKFRHYVYGEPFEVVTDHIALTWLMSLRDSKERLARWIVEMQAYDFEVLYERGDGEIMAVPDALSRDTMDRTVTLCHRCLEAVNPVPRRRTTHATHLKSPSRLRR
jgi:RNase H-like domain found in reverse transcriptase